MSIILKLIYTSSIAVFVDNNNDSDSFKSKIGYILLYSNFHKQNHIYILEV